MDESAKGFQSYYRWNYINKNINNKNDSVLDQRARFKEPPIPCKTINSVKQVEESMDPLDSDFSDEDRDESHSADRNRLINRDKNRLNDNRLNAIDSYGMNHANHIQTKSQSMVTDIYQFVN